MDSRRFLKALLKYPKEKLKDATLTQIDLLMDVLKYYRIILTDKQKARMEKCNGWKYRDEVLRMEGTLDDKKKYMEKFSAQFIIIFKVLIPHAFENLLVY